MDDARVLIVEDDPMVAEINRQFVRAVPGFTPLGVAATGQEAVRLTAGERPDLVLLDVYLPDKSGLAVLQEIRQNGLPADIILITAAQDVETIQNAFRYGAIDYIIKPFKFSRLKSALLAYAALRESFHRHSLLSQDALDQLALNKARLPGEELPKGLHEVTLKQVMLYLIKQNRPLSAEEVAQATGLARVTARRYLDYLEKSGQVKLEMRYGSVGRPVNRYRV
ncbi:MAG: response regulator [Peptococcaceae bacterium]|jgi:two-component system response regulator DctR|nr:response regulator [Peptococcaceae bacterium]